MIDYDDDNDDDADGKEEEEEDDEFSLISKCLIIFTCIFLNMYHTDWRYLPIRNAFHKFFLNIFGGEIKAI